MCYHFIHDTQYRHERIYPRVSVLRQGVLILSCLLLTDKRAVYTTNPNGTAGTAGHKLWFQKAPFSWLSNLEASCQSQALMLGSTYMTTHMGFSYTLISLSRQDENNKTIQTPGAPYLNSTLKDCEVGSIQVYPARKDTSMRSGNSWTWGDTHAAVSSPARLTIVPRNTVTDIFSAGQCILRHTCSCLARDSLIPSSIPTVVRHCQEFSQS